MLPLDHRAALEKIMPEPGDWLAEPYGEWQVSIYTKPDAAGNERRAVFVSRPRRPTIVGCLAEAEHAYSMSTNLNLRIHIARIEIVPVER